MCSASTQTRPSAATPGSSAIATDAGAVFETHHRRSSTLGYHVHRIAFATIVLQGWYTEVRDGIVPRPCERGSLVIHRAGEEHADHFLFDAHCLNVELPHAEGLAESVTVDASLRSAVYNVVRSFYCSSEALHAAVAGFQTELQRHAGTEPSTGPQWLRHVLDRFAWSSAAPLRDAAKLAGVHPVQFSRAFHRHVGMTSNEYRKLSRVRLASELLLATAKPLVRIAQSCGFADQSHLTRTFTQTLGLSPAQYRRVFAR